MDHYTKRWNMTVLHHKQSLLVHWLTSKYDMLHLQKSLLNHSAYLSSLTISAWESRFKASNHALTLTPIILTLTQKSTNWKISINIIKLNRTGSLNTEIRMKRELRVKQTVLQKSTIKLSRAAACNTKFDSKWCSKYSVKASSSQTNFLSVFFPLGNLVEFVRVKLI
jgi:hypothetical protein